MHVFITSCIQITDAERQENSDHELLEKMAEELSTYINSLGDIWNEKE